MKYWFPVRIAAVLVAVAVDALAGARADSDMDAQIRDIVETELAPTATAADPGGLAAAVYAGGRVTVFDFGFADAAAERTITSDTLFNLASLRKLFEATLVALGRERGEDNRAAMMPEIMQRMVQGYSHDGTPIGPIGNQQSYYDFPGAGQMFSSVRDLRILLRACLDRGVIDPELRGALQMTMRESFRVDAKFGQAMAWEPAARRRHRHRQAGRSQQCVGLYRSGACAQVRDRAACQSWRLPARDRALQDFAGTRAALTKPKYLSNSAC